jgi:hypothetical protein
VLVAVGIATLTVVQTSYQVGRPTVTLPVNTVTEPLVAASVGLALFDETVRFGGWRAPVVVAAMALMGVGLVALSRTSALGTDPAFDGTTSGEELGTT